MKLKVIHAVVLYALTEIRRQILPLKFVQCAAAGGVTEWTVPEAGGFEIHEPHHVD